METTTAALLSGYRGSKVHAVDPTFRPTVSLCGWGVDVSELPFTDNGLACKVCAKAAANR